MEMADGLCSRSEGQGLSGAAPTPLGIGLSSTACATLFSILAALWSPFLASISSATTLKTQVSMHTTSSGRQRPPPCCIPYLTSPDWPCAGWARVELTLPQAEKVKLREDIAAHMAAHAANVKAAKPRINRDELAKLGADFAARMHNVPAAASPQVLVVELEPVDKAAPGPAHPAGRAPAPSSAPGGCKTGPGASPLKARAAAAAPSPAKGTPAAHKPAAQQQKTPAAEPPWRAARGARASRAPGGFPDVQIFTPFGSEITPPSSAEPKTRPKPSPQPQPQRQQPAAKSTRSPSLPSPSKPPPQAPAHPQAPSAGVEASLADRVRAAWAKRGKAELLQVLSEIQEVGAAVERSHYMRYLVALSSYIKG